MPELLFSKVCLSQPPVYWFSFIPLIAVQCLERAQNTRSTSDLEVQDPFGADVSPMLGEAFVTLAALTLDDRKKEEFFARASAEGINIDEDDHAMEEAL